MLFVSQKYEAAVSRINDLIAVSMNDETTYCCVQVLKCNRITDMCMTMFHRSLEKCISCKVTTHVRYSRSDVDTASLHPVLVLIWRRSRS